MKSRAGAKEEDERKQPIVKEGIQESPLKLRVDPPPPVVTNQQTPHDNIIHQIENIEDDENDVRGEGNNHAPPHINENHQNKHGPRDLQKGA